MLVRNVVQILTIFWVAVGICFAYLSEIRYGSLPFWPVKGDNFPGSTSKTEYKESFILFSGYHDVDSTPHTNLAGVTPP